MLVKLGKACRPQYLHHKHRHNTWANGVHETHVVTDEGLAAATAVQVQLLRVVVVVVVRRVVQELLLDAGPRGSRVTAAERDTIHQEAAIHIAPHTTTSQKTKQNQC